MVEVWRGDLLESVHRVHAAVCDAEGVVVRAWGDSGRMAYLRSSAKPLQAVPLVASGAASAFGVTDAEIAVACGSHSAEAFHLDAVRSLLHRAGLNESDLRCGPQRPGLPADSDALVRAGREPEPIHNNCSGKHAGMLAVARHIGAPAEGYLEPAHPVQRLIRSVLGHLAGVSEDAIPMGVDGCGAPTFALSLAQAAGAFARLAGANTGQVEIDLAARRIPAAMMAHPAMVGGTGNFVTLLMGALAGAVFCKTGAEGYFCAGVPGRGLGIALKVEDGSGRGAPPAALHILHALAVLTDPLPAALAEWRQPTVTNPRRAVGVEIRVRAG